MLDHRRTGIFRSTGGRPLTAVRRRVACAALFLACSRALAADRPVTVMDDIGRPLSGAVIRAAVSAAEAPPLATSDGQGVLGVPREPAAGDYLVERDGHVTLVLSGADLRALDELILVRAASFAGVVRDALSGAPVKGIQVELAQRGEGKPVTVVTDDSGRFEARNLAPGGVRLRAEASGYLTTVLEASLAPGASGMRDLPIARPGALRVALDGLAPGTLPSGVRAEVRSGSGFPAGVEFRAAAGKDGARAGASILPQSREAAKGASEVSLTVPVGVPLELRFRAAGFCPVARPLVVRETAETVRAKLPPGLAVGGRLVDDGGRAVAGVRVRPRYLDPAVDELLDWGGASPARSKEDGTFRLPDLPQGALSVELVASDWILPRLDPVRLEGTGADFGKIELRPGGTFTGRVVRQSTAQPVAGARVRGCLEELGCAWSLETKSGNDGTFRLAGASKGRWTLEVSHSDYPSARSEGLTAGSGEVRIELPDGGKLTGRALGPDGSPLGRVRVQALPPDGGEDTVVDRTVDTTDGRFEVSSAPPGTWAIVLRASGFGPVRLSSREIRAGDATDVGDILFFAGRVARGTVLGADDARISAATVAVRGENASSDSLTVTGSDGRFEISGLPDERFDLVATAGGYAPSLLSYPSAGPGDSLELPERAVRLFEGGSLEGEVRGEAEAPVSGARIRLPGYSEVTPAVTDLQGRYRMDHVPAADLSVQMIADPAAPEGWTETRRVTVRDGAVSRLDFASAGTLTGVVRRDGQGVPFARISAVASGGIALVHTAESDAVGEFRLSGITDGTWTLHVSSAECQARFPLSRAAGEKDRRLELDLPSEDLAGWVFDESSNEPLPSAEVLWEDTGASMDVISYRMRVPSSSGGVVVLEDRPVAGAVTRAGADGSFRLCVPGTGEVEVEAAAGPKFEEAYATLALPPREPLTLKLRPKGNEVTVVVLRPDGARASRNTSVALVHRNGFYEVVPAGAGGEAKFERPKSAFRAWAGIPGVGLGASDWIGEDDEVTEPIAVSVTAGGYLSARGIGPLRARAAALGTELEIRLIDPSGEDLFPRADSLGVLEARETGIPGEEVLGPFPYGRYVLHAFVGAEQAASKEVEISAQPAILDLSP